MFAVVITEKGGAQRRVDFDKSEVTIGRVQGNDIILPKGNVSKRHSRIVLKDNRFIVVDLKSTNGTYVNGRKITSPLVVKSGDKIYIGDFILTVEEPGGAAAAASGPAPAGPPMAVPPMGPPALGGPPPLAGHGGPPPLAGHGGPPPLGAGPPAMGPPPMAAPSPMGGPPPLGPPMGGPPPMGPPPMAAPPPLAAPPPAGMSHATMAHGGMGAPPMPAEPRPPSMRPPPAMPARPAPAPLGAPPPLPARPAEAAEPPAVPPGGDRYNLDEDPADETVAPSPRVVAQKPQPRMEPPAPAPRMEPPRAEPPRAAPAPMAPAPEPVRAAEPIRMPEPATAPAPRAIEVGSLGPLEAMLEEPGVLEIVCEGPARISVDRGTGLVGASVKFGSEGALTGAVARLFSMAGAPLMHGHGAIHEATLGDGTHVLCVLPPVAVGGPYVEIRRLGRPAVPGESLVAQGVLSADMLQTLRSAVAVRRNVVLVGPSDAGVSALVGVLASAIHADERIATIEASPEIALPTGRAIRFVGSAGGLGTVLRRAAAIRADRLVIDGVTGPDLRDALVLLASRSGGGILAVRAYAPGPMLEQLEALASLGGARDGLAALVGSVAHVVVRMGRGADGVRRVESIAEIGNEGLVELFEHGENGFASTGTRPTFLG